jgi:predicted NodU family carbamoyl transferase
VATHILGITAWHRDSAAALIRDGEVVAAVCEKRFSSRRGDQGFPVEAVTYCLREAQLPLDAVDVVLFCDLLQSGGGLRSLVTALRRSQLRAMLRRELTALAGSGRHALPPLALATRRQAQAALSELPELLPGADAELSVWQGAAAAAAGAALHYWQEQLGQSRVGAVTSPWLGPWFGGDGIAAWLDEQRLAYRCLAEDDLVRIVAQRLMHGESIGWLQGRLEFCERSLGGRSILIASAASRLEHQLSQQAPVLFVLDEAKAREWLRQPAQRALAAQVSTAPLHVVTAALQPRLHRLLRQLADHGLPLLLGFDLREAGEPLAAAPVDAYRCFLRRELDHLVMEDLLLSRREQPLWDEALERAIR